MRRPLRGEAQTHHWVEEVGHHPLQEVGSAVGYSMLEAMLPHMLHSRLATRKVGSARRCRPRRCRCSRCREGEEEEYDPLMNPLINTLIPHACSWVWVVRLRGVLSPPSGWCWSLNGGVGGARCSLLAVRGQGSGGGRRRCAQLCRVVPRMKLEPEEFT